MIELVDIVKRFGGAAALAGVSLRIEPGDRLALVGENGAGKSSLMNVLYGLYQPDAGEVRFDGVRVRLQSPADALARGVGMVHQHFTLVPTLSVTENVVLGAEPKRGLLLDLDGAARQVAATCRRLGFELDVHARVETLTVGSQQKVEIVKALHRGAGTLILDEPTAVLTPQESEELLEVTRELSRRGLAVVLITHKLKEALSFASRIAVMRRGLKVAEVAPADTNPQALATLMVGEARAITQPATTPTAMPSSRESPQMVRGASSASGEGSGSKESTPPKASTASLPSGASGTSRVSPAALRLEHVSAAGLHDVSLEVRAGEVLGVAGVDGNGQRELAEVVTGLAPFLQGRLELAGEVLPRLSPSEARRRGVVHIPEDRLARALIAELSVEENVALGQHAEPPFARRGRVDFAGRRARAEALLEAHDVRPRDARLAAGALSGGNQQKLVVGRELAQAPRLVVVVQPTRGLDVAAVEAVRGHLLAEARRGCGVLLVSLDLEELLALADRLVVLRAGRVVALVEREAFDEQAIGRHMLGVAHG